MRRSTPNSYSERPPFTTSSQMYNRSTTPVAPPHRRGTSPTVTRSRVEFGRAVQGGQQPTPSQYQRHASPSASAHYPQRHASPSASAFNANHRPRSSPPSDENIGVMLTDLVALSHNIERYIAENPLAVSGGNQSSPNQRALKAEEIERVVRRVEVHFKARIEELDKIVQEQKEAIVQLSREREMWKRRAEAGGEASSSKRDLEVASDAATPRDTIKDVQNLRQTLAEEKRQRLLVEEQTQHLTEQHTKVVNTLEQRIRKQEKQLQSMVEVFEQHGASHNNPAGGNSNGSGTPRSLKFRQRQLRFDEHPPTPDRTTAAAASSGEPLYAHRVSVSSYANDEITDVIDVSGKSSPLDPSPPSTVVPLEVDADMDDVAAFLANISKELESISSVEAQRQNKIAALSY